MIYDGSVSHRILDWMSQQDHDPTTREVAAAVGLTREHASIALRGLVDRGHVEDMGPEQSRRPGDRGRAHCYRVLHGWQAHILPPSEANAMARAEKQRQREIRAGMAQAPYLSPLEAAWPSPAHDLVAMRLPVSRVIPGCISALDSDSTGG